MKKSEYMYELAREHICALDNASYELGELVVDIENIVESVESPKQYAKAFKDLGKLIERMNKLQEETDVDCSLSRAARKYELDEHYKEAKRNGELPEPVPQCTFKAADEAAKMLEKRGKL